MVKRQRPISYRVDNMRELKEALLNGPVTTKMTHKQVAWHWEQMTGEAITTQAVAATCQRAVRKLMEGLAEDPELLKLFTEMTRGN
jgi:Na+-translocating ferredoxin:NAD+ oxidoreductase RnfG subunit